MTALNLTKTYEMAPLIKKENTRGQWPTLKPFISHQQVPISTVTKLNLEMQHQRLHHLSGLSQGAIMDTV